MEGELLDVLGELGAHIGMRLIGHAAKAKWNYDRAKLADAVLNCSVHQTSGIVRRLGLGRRIEARDFGYVVGVISTEQEDVIRMLTNIDIDVLTDCSFDVEDTLHRAWMALQR